MVETLARPDTKDALARVSVEAENSTPDALTGRIKRAYEFVRRIAQIANVKTD